MEKSRFDIDISNIAAINEFLSDEPFSFEIRSRRWDGFVYFDKGEGSFVDSEGRAYEIKNSTLFLLRAGESYSISLSSGYHYIASAYKILSSGDNAAYDLPRVVDCDDGIKALVTNIFRSWKKPNEYSVLNCKIQILSLYLELFKKHLTSSVGDKDVDFALDFIRKNYKRNFSAGEIAAYCKSSESNIRLKFRKLLGTSILKHREIIRIDEAKKMLSSALFTPKQVAYELGYSDVYHFTKSFKKITGTTPAAYGRAEVR